MTSLLEKSFLAGSSVSFRQESRLQNLNEGMRASGSLAAWGAILKSKCAFGAAKEFGMAKWGDFALLPSTALLPNL